jgi:hypothetical protein
MSTKAIFTLYLFYFFSPYVLDTSPCQAKHSHWLKHVLRTKAVNTGALHVFKGSYSKVMTEHNYCPVIS